MIGKGEILVIDDFIDIEYQEEIKDHLMGQSEINGEQFIKPEKFKYDEVKFNAVTKKLKFEEFNISKNDKKITQIIEYWFDNKIKTDGFDGDLNVTVKKINIERIKEDKLRILRFFRFLAEFDKNIEDIDSITLKALKKYKKDLKLISKERLRMELERIISVYTPQKMFSIMIRLGILDDIFPSIKIDGLRQLLKAEKKYHITAPPLVRLLSLNSAIGDKWSKYVALSKKEKRFLEDISQSLETYSELMVVAYKFGPNVAESWLLNLGNKVSKVKPNEVKKIIENGCKVLFPIKGEDLLEEFEEGPEIGNTLINLEKLWVNSGFKMSKKDLLSKIPTNFKAI